MSLAWYASSRGTESSRDYAWSGAHGRLTSPTLSEVVSASKVWAAPTGTSVVVGVASRTLWLYVTGLRNTDWPKDHQGREIGVSLVFAATGSDIDRALESAAQLLVGEAPGDLVLFDPASAAGWIENPRAIEALLSGVQVSVAEPLDRNQCLWTSERGLAARHVARLGRFVQDHDDSAHVTLAVVSGLLTRDIVRETLGGAVLLCGEQLPERVVVSPKELAERPSRPKPPTWTSPVVATLMGLTILVVVWVFLRR